MVVLVRLRKLANAASIAIGAFFKGVGAWLTAYFAGRAAQRAKQAEYELQVVAEANKVRNAIRRMHRNELVKWMQDNKLVRSDEPSDSDGK